MTDLEAGEDGVAIAVYTSRATRLEDLRRRFRLQDSTGTRYELVTKEPEVIDGRATLVFTPPLPEGATWLQLQEPGTSVVWMLGDQGHDAGGGPG